MRPDRRPFAGPDDLYRLQAFNSAAISAVGHAGYLHPGDIAHRLYNGQRWFDPEEVLFIYEGRGEIAAWVMVYPRLASFELQIAPGRREPAWERELLGEAEAEAWAAIERHGTGKDELVIDVFEGDAARVAAVRDLGWAQGTDGYVLTRASLDPLPPIELEPGYSIRPAGGIVEAGEIAEIHSAGFGSEWTEEMYRKVMLSPGYDPTRELLVVAPDGSFAGFCVLWFDRATGLGLFEPLATHPDHRRIGVGRALLAAGMHEMKDARLDTATVMYEEANPGSSALYRSLGFMPTWRILDWHKARD
jgi:ribosomal protein S18 acetylase RimI-like enzyme